MKAEKRHTRCPDGKPRGGFCRGISSPALLTGVFGVMSALYWMDFASHYMLVQTIVLGLMALTSFALSAVGIVVERWCRISGDDDSSATGASAAA